MADGAAEARRFELARGCERRLSGTRPRTMAEELAELQAAPVDLAADGDYYGGGGPVALLEERVAGLLGKPAAVFFPTGTMAQQVALRGWAARTGNPTVALHPQSHPQVHERGALSILTGLRPLWTNGAPRSPTAEEIRELDEQFGTLMLELPLRDPGFLLPTWDELVEVVAAGRDRGARIHFDGARLWESAPYLGQDLATIAALADSVYVSFYKGLGGLSGAAIAGPADFVTEARAWRHRYGGNVFRLWPAAVSALTGLEAELPRIPSYVEHARIVAAALATLPGARVHPRPPHTNQFQLWLPHPAEALNQAALALAERDRIWFVDRWGDHPPTGLAAVEVTVAGAALDWSPDDITAAATAFLSHLP